jgi:hypothetical protein
MLSGIRSEKKYEYLPVVMTMFVTLPITLPLLAELIDCMDLQEEAVPQRDN